MFASAIKRGIDWLLSIQDPSGAWPAVRPGDPLGAWSTAEVLYVMARFHEYASSHSLVRALEYILGEQHEDGGWPLIQDGRSNTLTTADAVLALSAIRPLTDVFPAETMKRALDARSLAVSWLKSNQLDDGGWAVQPGAVGDAGISRTIVVFNACRALYSLGESYVSSSEIRRAIAFLERFREGDVWGPYEGYMYAEVSNTAYAVLTLVNSGKHRAESDYIQSSVDAILRTPNEQFVWDAAGEDVSLPSGKITLNYNTTVHVLWALLVGGRVDTTTLKLVNWLVHEQESEGQWEMKRLDGTQLNISTFVTTDALLTLEAAGAVLQDEFPRALSSCVELLQYATGEMDEGVLEALKQVEDLDLKRHPVIRLGKHTCASRNIISILVCGVIASSLAFLGLGAAYLVSSGLCPASGVQIKAIALVAGYAASLPVLLLGRLGWIAAIQDLDRSTFVTIMAAVLGGLPAIIWGFF